MPFTPTYTMDSTPTTLAILEGTFGFGDFGDGDFGFVRPGEDSYVVSVTYTQDVPATISYTGE
jgi:hypothetical protein